MCFARGLLRYHRRPVASATPMLGDNKDMHSLVTQEGASVRTRYYERATLLIKRATLMLLLSPMLVSTNDMIADIFTKALEKAIFYKFRDIVMNRHSTLHDTLATAVCDLRGNSWRLADRLMRQL